MPHTSRQRRRLLGLIATPVLLALAFLTGCSDDHDDVTPVGVQVPTAYAPSDNPTPTADDPTVAPSNTNPYFTLDLLSAICRQEYNDDTAVVKVVKSSDWPSYWLKCSSKQIRGAGDLDLDAFCQSQGSARSINHYRYDRAKADAWRYWYCE
jgi:hypothetical protein